MENLVGQFPRNLHYSIKQLSGLSKTTVKLTPDRTSCNKGDSIRVKLPPNTIVDLRTFAMYAKGTCTNTGNRLHFPRLTQSLIKNLSIFINGTLVERISDYNLLYSKLYDIDGGGIDQLAKRHLEIADPSVRYSVAGEAIPAEIFAGATDAGGAETWRAGTPLVCTDGTGPSADTDRKLAITSWIGFLSTLSTPCPDLNDFGSMEIQIDFADEKILFAASSTLNTAPTLSNPSWSLSDIYFTVSKIQFQDPLYYNMKASKLLSSGLQLGFQTYIGSKGTSVAKTSAVNVQATVNTTSLDQLVCFFNPEVPNINPLLLYNSNSVADSLTFQQVLSGYDKNVVADVDRGTYVAQTANTTKIGEIVRIKGMYNAGVEHTSYGDAFNNSYFFKSDAIGLGSSSIEINNTPLHPSPLEDIQCYNETLISLGNLQQDMGSGVYPGLRSLSDYLKYFFVVACSLENISNESSFYKSGLDGKSSALNINWRVNFSTTDTMKQTPYIFAKCTRIVQINEGNSVIVII